MPDFAMTLTVIAGLMSRGPPRRVDQPRNSKNGNRQCNEDASVSSFRNFEYDTG